MTDKALDLSYIYNLYEHDKVDDALKLCDEVLKVNKNNSIKKSIINYYKGLIYEDKSQYENAIKAYKKSHEENNKYTAPLLRQYEVYRKQNLLNHAFGIIEKFIKSYPDKFYGYDLKFNFLFNMRAYEEAEEVITFLEDNFEESDIVKLNKVKVYVMTKRLREALQLIESCDESSEIYYDLLLEKAKLLAIDENLEGSLDILLDLNSKFKNNNYIIYLSASIYIIKGKLKEANLILEQLLDRDYCEEMAYLLGLYYYGVTLKATSLDQSNEYFEKTLRRFNVYSINNPNDLNIILLRAMCNYEIKNYKEALRLVDYVEDISLECGETSFIKALIYFDMGQYDNYDLAKNKVKSKDQLLYKTMIKIEEVKK